ncbi:MAG: hypothetical protein RLZ98_1325 [Pseudomonadota bacterium]|jgi:tripartite-type tricarboxylate transporter receptor subunit TctC
MLHETTCQKFAVTLLALIATVTAARSQDEFKGRTIQIYTGFGTGGAYDGYARLLARHMGRQLPGQPGFVVKGMPGAASVRMMNYLYNVAKKDGTEIGIPSQGIAQAQAFKEPGIEFDVRKMHWLGSTHNTVNVAFSFHTSPIKKIEDVFEKELVVGATGPGSATSFFPRLMNALLGTKFKIVEGYSGQDLQLAIERGEVAGRAAYNWSNLRDQTDWVQTKKANLLVQMGSKRAPDLPNLPLMHELAKDKLAREVLKLVSLAPSVGRPFVAPPGLPGSRVALLRNAFDATMKDAAFLADASKSRFPIEPTSGAELSQLVKEIVEAPSDVIDYAKNALPKRKKKN